MVDEDRRPVFVTLNRMYRSRDLRQGLRFLVHVDITTIDRNPAGLPTENEAAILNDVEDRITARLFAAERTAFVGRATSFGHRELFYYVGDAAQANAVLTSFRRDHRDWEFAVADQADWHTVMPLLDDESPCI
jgi:Family of unknown function (DUF695)